MKSFVLSLLFVLAFAGISSAQGVTLPDWDATFSGRNYKRNDNIMRSTYVKGQKVRREATRKVLLAAKKDKQPATTTMYPTGRSYSSSTYYNPPVVRYSWWNYNGRVFYRWWY